MVNIMDTKRITKEGVYSELLSLKENGEEKNYYAVVDARNGGKFEVRAVLDHLGENTKAKCEIRAVAAGGAVVNLYGMVHIARGARGTDSFLKLKVLLLDNQSMAIAEPELSIENNDVKASHSASVGMVDEESVLYLMSRGLTKTEAENLLVEGFLRGD